MRRICRVAQGEGGGLGLSLELPTGERFAAEVFALDGPGTEAQVSFSSERGPDLAPGVRATLRFSLPKLPEPLVVPVTVQSRADREAFRRYVFALEMGEDLARRLCGAIDDALSFRVAHRFEVPSEEAPEVVLRTEGFEARGRLKNISATGLAVFVEPEVDRTLHALKAVEASFRPPSSGAPLRVEARPRHRTERKGAVFYGMEFALESSEGRERQQNEILTYVSRLQRMQIQRQARV